MRAQASIEYLMTYGWAILALVLAIGFIFVSGALNPSNFLTEECSLSQDIVCTNHIAYLSDNQVILKFEIRNNYPYKLILKEGSLSPSSSALSFSKSTLLPGETAIISATLPVIDIVKEKIHLSYSLVPFETDSESSTYEVSGIIVAKVNKQ